MQYIPFFTRDNKKNERDAKYDLRDWNEDHTKMGKGITLNEEEFLKLKEAYHCI